MRNPVLKIIGTGVVAVVLMAFGFYVGVRQGQLQCALEEVQVARAALVRDDIKVGRSCGSF